MVTQEQVLESLKNCYDPEIPLSIVDLGLVYEVRVDGASVYVKMTLSSPGCPLHGTISQSVKQEVEKLDEVERAEVEVVWQPPWTPDRMSPEARRKLGWGGK
ncbi:MAG: metal-sulfur cluster assembly factor [Dehalococcoidia bacterium]|jgi:metal-sulfur cluster biosynthetic enzyme|nr:metal-sulfur cluster assembly factor [Dehalococcoidia bacterium]MDP7240410.1 metal-sulfur cluster assembly factor [Dehalococcoidia bacterium]MDP7469772.1 metal-sulfur cluster assembly factor [Dehalococcoidia bacterium]